MRDGTRVVRTGLPNFAQGEPFLPGPTFANPYHLAGDPSSSPYSYGRYHNPTWTHFEQALSELEGGTAVIFASERRARWGGDAIPDGLIRLSVGCEDSQDLLDDITQALATVSTAEGNHP